MSVPGDEAIVPDPADFLLERSVLAAGGDVQRWPVAGGYDAEELVSPRTRLRTSSPAAAERRAA